MVLFNLLRGSVMQNSRVLLAHHTCSDNFGCFVLEFSSTDVVG